jgi:hypothetical protein
VCFFSVFEVQLKFSGSQEPGDKGANLAPPPSLVALSFPRRGQPWVSDPWLRKVKTVKYCMVKVAIDPKERKKALEKEVFLSWSSLILLQYPESLLKSFSCNVSFNLVLLALVSPSVLLTSPPFGQTLYLVHC